MPITFRRRVVLAAGATVLAAASVALLIGVPAQATPYNKELRAVRAATAKFHSLQQAAKAGYVATPVCVSTPAGGEGIHYDNPELMATPEIDHLQPEVLIYAPNRNGQLKLVAVEYFVAAAGLTQAPELFGQRFDGPMPGHHPGQPAHYELHTWIWEDNPRGTFAQFNPAVSC